MRWVVLNSLGTGTATAAALLAYLAPRWDSNSLPTIASMALFAAIVSLSQALGLPICRRFRVRWLLATAPTMAIALPLVASGLIVPTLLAIAATGPSPFFPFTAAPIAAIPGAIVGVFTGFCVSIAQSASIRIPRDHRGPWVWSSMLGYAGAGALFGFVLPLAIMLIPHPSSLIPSIAIAGLASGAPPGLLLGYVTKVPAMTFATAISVPSDVEVTPRAA